MSPALSPATFHIASDVTSNTLSHQQYCQQHPGNVAGNRLFIAGDVAGDPFFIAGDVAGDRWLIAGDVTGDHLFIAGDIAGDCWLVAGNVAGDNYLVTGNVAGDTLSRWRCRWRKRLEGAGKSLAALLVISRQR